MTRAIALVGMVVGLAASVAHGMGADYPPGPVRLENWTERFAGVANAHRVHGWWVNWYETFYFAGDTVALSAFLDAYAELPEATKRVTLRQGEIVVRSPWDRAPRATVANWSLRQERALEPLTLFPMPERGRSLAEWELAPPKWRTSVVVNVERSDLGALRVPVSLKVVVDSKVDDVVWRFVEAHEARRAQADREAGGEH